MSAPWWISSYAPGLVLREACASIHASPPRTPDLCLWWLEGGKRECIGYWCCGQHQQLSLSPGGSWVGIWQWGLVRKAEVSESEDGGLSHCSNPYCCVPTSSPNFMSLSFLSSWNGDNALFLTGFLENSNQIMDELCKISFWNGYIKYRY